MIELYKEILLKTFQDFDTICEQNDIKYVAAYGTVLGAVRHKGLIPWDDDIDVYMTRENYKKFLALKDNVLGKDYEIFSYEDKGYYLPFAKFCNKKTSIWEYKEFPFVIGVFVDIFPLDEYSISNEGHKKLYKKNLYYRKKYFTSLQTITLKEKFKKGNFIRNCLSYINLKIFVCPFKQLFFKKFNNLDKKIQNLEGDYYLCYPEKDYKILPKDWIQNTIEVPYETFKIRIPKEYDKYLTYLYGDYMTPPPVSQRDSGHVAIYLDLNERREIDQITRSE